MIKQIKISIAILFLATTTSNVFGAYLENVPITLTQPNGKIINCFATGDEYYNWVHDKDGFTIIQNSKTGYYCYAMLQDGNLIASQYIVGVNNPSLSGLKPNINITTEQALNIRKSLLKDTPEKRLLRKDDEVSIKSAATSGTLNNLVIYITFSNQTEFPAEQFKYTNLFNTSSSNASSMYNYFKEVSYNKLSIISSFYPQNNGTTILSYKDPNSRNYYCEKNATNTIGYSNSTEKEQREHTLLKNAILSVSTQIPSSLNIDNDNDGYVDNICFIIRGDVTAWNTLLWPHRWALYTHTVNINSKRVWDYNIQIEDHLAYSGVGVLCHEMFHTLGAPDLYRSAINDITPVGIWDIMATNYSTPQSMSAYMKYKYGKWISSIPEITQSGQYTLNPITSSTNNCYRISTSRASEYFVLEFRKKVGTFENSLPSSGLLIYRINTNIKGNFNGPPDEIYVSRPNGSTTNDGLIYNALFDYSYGRDKFHNTSNPNCFLSDGVLGNIYIKNIVMSGNTLSFDVRFCNGTNIVYSNTNLFPGITNASNRIETQNSVIVRNAYNVIFEASQEVLLNDGFEVQSNGIFEVNNNGCGN